MRRYGSVYLVKQNVLVYFGYNWKDRNGMMIWLLILMCFFMKGCHVTWFPYQQTWLGINEVINNTWNFTGQNWWGQAGSSWRDLLNTNWLLGIKIVCMKFEGKVVIFYLDTMNTWMIAKFLWSGILRTSNIDKIIVQGLCVLLQYKNFLISVYCPNRKICRNATKYINSWV